MKSKRNLTANDLLRIWGLMYATGDLKDVIRKVGTGEEGGLDEEQTAKAYVETCPGFHEALPVLRWKYVHFREPEDFDPCLPGETLEGALKRQEMHSALGLARRQVGSWVHDRFLNALIDKTRREPFVHFEEVEERFSALRCQPA